MSNMLGLAGTQGFLCPTPIARRFTVNNSVHSDQINVDISLG